MQHVLIGPLEAAVPTGLFFDNLPAYAIVPMGHHILSDENNTRVVNERHERRPSRGRRIPYRVASTWRVATRFKAHRGGEKKWHERYDMHLRDLLHARAHDTACPSVRRRRPIAVRDFLPRLTEHNWIGAQNHRQRCRCKQPVPFRGAMSAHVHIQLALFG